MTSNTLFRFVQLRDTTFVKEQTPVAPPEPQKEDPKIPAGAGKTPIELASDDVQRFYDSVGDDLRKKPILSEAEYTLKEAERYAKELRGYVQTVERIRANPAILFDEMIEVFGLDIGDQQAIKRHRFMMVTLPKLMAAADILGNREQEIATFADAGRGALALVGAMTGAQRIAKRWPRPVDIASAPIHMDKAGKIVFPAPQSSTTTISQIVASTSLAASGADHKKRPQGRPHALSIGDLYVVEETETVYEMGDIAHIENVLKSERREREFTVNNIRENETYFETEETRNVENERVTNENQSFQSAIRSTVNKSNTFGVNTSVAGGFGPVEFSLGAMFSSTSSKSNSKSSAQSFAKSVMERSAEEVTTRVLENRRQLLRTEVTDKSVNGFDNRQGPNHVVGIYRFLNKVVSSQLRNYGARLMMDFVIPEPAALLVKMAQADQGQSGGAKKPEPAFTEMPQDIDEHNYRDFAAAYGAENVSAPPPFEIRINKSFTAEPPDKSDFASPEEDQPDMDKQNPNFGHQTGRVPFNDLPEGYYAFAAKASLANISKNYLVGGATSPIGINFGTRVELALGHATAKLGLLPDSNSSSGYSEQNTSSMGLLLRTGNGSTFAGLEGPLELAWACSSAYGVGVSVDLLLRRSHSTYHDWQMETWTQINQAYQIRLDAWETEQNVKSITGQTYGNNPLINRINEKRELKAGSLSTLLNHDFMGLSAIMGGRSDLPMINFEKSARQARAITFFEEAIDWENLSFQLYDYTWAGRGRWETLAARSANDPEHQDFLRSGAAKVTVPIQQGAEIALLNFLAGKDIWNEAVTDEIEKQFPDILKQLDKLGLVPGGAGDEVVEEIELAGTEVTRVPTNLLVLQDGPDPNATGWVGPIELPPAQTDTT